MLDRRPPALSVLLYALALLLVLLAIAPAVWLVRVAFQPAGADLDSFGGGVTLENFRGAWDTGGLGKPLVNSVIVTVVRTALNVLLAALAAYPLARMRFKGRDTLFVLILATMMIPEQVIVVPMFRIVVGMGLFDTLAAVVIPFSVTAFGIYLCRQAFMQIPVSLEEAARMDGASALRVWWSVMLPLSAPTLSTLALFSVISAWSELLWPLVVLQNEENFTLPVAINRLLGVFADNVRYAYAGSVLSLVPILLFFLAMNRWLKPSLFAGAVKG